MLSDNLSCSSASIVTSTSFEYAYFIKSSNLGTNSESTSFTFLISYLGCKAEIFIEIPFERFLSLLILLTSSIAFLYELK